MNVNTAADLITAISGHLAFNSSKKKISSNYIAVCSPIPTMIGGPLAADVIEAHEVYSKQYMENGDRTRKPEQIVYYVTRNYDGYVLGCVTADGTVRLSRPMGITEKTWDAIRQGMQHAGTRTPGMGY